MCAKPLSLKDMDVDHVVPEMLVDDPDRLSEVLAQLGRPKEFRINGFENWLPCCKACNNRKRDMVFEPSLLIQTELQRAAARAPRAEEMAAKYVTDRSIGNAINVLERAHEAGQLDTATLLSLFAAINEGRPAERKGEPVLLSPGYEIISEKDGLRVVRGQFGIGAMPTGDYVSPSFDCPVCGTGAAWNGIRCVRCGSASDD